MVDASPSTGATTAKLSTSGLMLNVTTILDIITRVASAAEVAGPGFKTLLEAAMSVFGLEDRAKIEDAYHQRMAQSDEVHADTQDALQAEADKAQPPSKSSSGEPV